MEHELTPEQIEQHKNDIDKLSQQEMARLWRFAPSGHPYFRNDIPELHEHFKARFKGFTPEISKKIGW